MWSCSFCVWSGDVVLSQVVINNNLACWNVPQPHSGFKVTQTNQVTVPCCSHLFERMKHHVLPPLIWLDCQWQVASLFVFFTLAHQYVLHAQDRWTWAAHVSKTMSCSLFCRLRSQLISAYQQQRCSLSPHALQLSPSPAVAFLERTAAQQASHSRLLFHLTFNKKLSCCLVVC